MANKLSDKQKACKRILQSGDRQRIYKCIDEMREVGTGALLPELFDLYQRYNDQEMRDKILVFLRDMKEKSVPEIFMKELKNRKWDSGLDMILSICWQSALDFSPYIEDFVIWAASDDMQVQMEALTNIEQFIFNKNAEGREKVRNSLKNIALNATGKKRELIMSFLAGMKG
ncbi:MAG: hypothetical protein ACQES1_08690 [Bacteroidota bacterium]